jgi:hypothetical protein
VKSDLGKTSLKNGCHCEPVFGEAISCSQAEDCFGEKQPLAMTSWGFQGSVDYNNNS